MQHIHPDGSGGNFAGLLPGGVSVYARASLLVSFQLLSSFKAFSLLSLLSTIVIFCQAYIVIWQKLSKTSRYSAGGWFFDQGGEEELQV